MRFDNDRRIVRELTERYLEVCRAPEQERRRRLWRRLHALEMDRPPVLVRPFCLLHEVPEVHVNECEDPVLSGLERQLRVQIFLSRIGDDQVFEPFLNLRAVHENQGQPIWGIPRPQYNRPDSYSAGDVYGDPPIKDPADAEMLSKLPHRIDEEKTAERRQKAEEAVGDLIDVNVDRSPLYAGRPAFLIPDLTIFRGMTQLMMDMIDNPEWLHGVLAFMRDAVLESFEAAERAGDWRTADSNNQAMAYHQDLPDPTANVPASMGDLWGYFHAQEYTLVSPAMHEEFCLRYQKPIMEKFGLTAYGCCEDLTQKVDMLRSVPNLRRIAVTPRADVEKCAERIGTDYAISWRPNPAEMVCCGFDEDKIRRIITEGLRTLEGCHFDVTLKDIVTVEHEQDRLSRWVEITRRAIDRECG